MSEVPTDWTRRRFTILGCGSSPGVPRVHGEWGNCDPANPRNRRTRCSLLIEQFAPGGVTTVVVDTSPDFRAQMLAAGARQLDAVVYTHPHADHMHGIDDLRQYALLQRHRMPVYADKDTLAHLTSSFFYCFETPQGSMYPPICEPRQISAGKVFGIDGLGGTIEFLPVLQIHGPIHSLGFRIGDFCYSPDVSDIPASSLKHLSDLSHWVVDALQYRPHISHFSLSEALEWIERLKPDQAILTHMHIPLDYETVQKETPENVVPAHDGMVIEIDNQ